MGKYFRGNILLWYNYFISFYSHTLSHFKFFKWKPPKKEIIRCSVFLVFNSHKRLPTQSCFNYFGWQQTLVWCCTHFLNKKKETKQWAGLWCYPDFNDRLFLVQVWKIIQWQRLQHGLPVTKAYGVLVEQSKLDLHSLLNYLNRVSSCY